MLLHLILIFQMRFLANFVMANQVYNICPLVLVLIQNLNKCGNFYTSLFVFFLHYLLFFFISFDFSKLEFDLFFLYIYLLLADCMYILCLLNHNIHMGMDSLKLQT